MNFLNPFQVNHWDHADFQVGVFRHIYFLGDHGSVQPFVEKQIGPFGKRFPLREGPGRRAIFLGLHGIVYVMSRVASATLTVFAEHTFQVLEKVGLRTEMAEMMIALRSLFRHHPPHLQAVVAMKRVAFDIECLHLLAAENLLERIPDGCSPSA
ncbi:MAG TPA: hypothetical protein VJ228_01705 [Candidatus Acidoferrales bacterium]|nr:hypothetical protein [Candidatus Acidoferrales bacterium]